MEQRYENTRLGACMRQQWPRSYRAKSRDELAPPIAYPISKRDYTGSLAEQQRMISSLIGVIYAAEERHVLLGTRNPRACQ